VLASTAPLLVYFLYCILLCFLPKWRINVFITFEKVKEEKWNIVGATMFIAEIVEIPRYRANSPSHLLFILTCLRACNPIMESVPIIILTGQIYSDNSFTWDVQNCSLFIHVVLMVTC